MQKIANAQKMKREECITFEHHGQSALLVKTKQDMLVAYYATCPHEGGTIEWDAEIHKLVCECHLSLFNVADGTIYRQSSIFKKIGNLIPIALKIDEHREVYAD
jgi:nitrite reductase/ring-hydroxylating ferredoxin subunit